MENTKKFAEHLSLCPLVMIYRGLEARDCLEMTHALAETGIRCFEVTMNTPNAVEIIRYLRERTGPEISIGAGTVVSEAQVRPIAEAGAGFIISPNVNGNVIRATREAAMASVPGAFTPTEVLQAWECGADIVKIFPVNVVSAEYIRQLRGPFQDIPFMATGGVRPDLAADLYRAGAEAIGISVHLLGQELVASRDWKGLQRSAMLYVSATDSKTERRLLHEPVYSRSGSDPAAGR